MLMPPPGVGEMLGMPSSGSLHPRSIARHSSWGRVCGSRVRVSLPLPPSWDSHWQHHPVCVRVCVCVRVLHCVVVGVVVWKSRFRVRAVGVSPTVRVSGRNLSYPDLSPKAGLALTQECWTLPPSLSALGHPQHAALCRAMERQVAATLTLALALASPDPNPNLKPTPNPNPSPNPYLRVRVSPNPYPNPDPSDQPP